MLDGGSDLIPSVRRGTEWVGQGHVFPMGEQLLDGLGVTFHEAAEPQLVSLNEFVYVVCGGHRYGSPPRFVRRPYPKDPLCDHTTLFTQVREGYILWCCIDMRDLVSLCIHPW